MPHQYQRHSPVPPAPATWIVVADAGRARIFAVKANDGALAEVDDLLNPEARLQAQALESDRPGSAAVGSRNGGGAFETPQSHGEHIAEVFAKRLCLHLRDARCSGALGKLYLLAAPSFLGLLRSHLDEPTRRLVVEERAADLVRHPPGEIRKALPAVL